MYEPSGFRCKLRPAGMNEKEDEEKKIVNLIHC